MTAKVTKELIANCYSATLPDDDFNARLKEVLAKTDPKRVHELYQNAFVVQSIRQVALAQTAGFSALVKTLNTAEVLAEAERVRLREINRAREEEQRNTRQLVASEQLDSRYRKAARFAEGATKVILLFLCILCTSYILHDYGILGKPPAERSIAAEVILAGATIYGVVDVFGVIPAASVRGALEQQVLRLMKWLQQQLV